jgi:hypothetical protein
MKSIKIAGLCVAAVFAFTAVAAGSASAQPRPEFKLCKKVTSGKYTEKNCNTAGTGKYELETAPTGTSLSGKSKVTTIEALTRSKEAVTVKCKTDKVTGATTGPSSFSETIKYSSCEAKAREKCSNGKAGEIVVSGNVALYWVNKAETEPGAAVDLEAEFDERRQTGPSGGLPVRQRNGWAAPVLGSLGRT